MAQVRCVFEVRPRELLAEGLIKQGPRAIGAALLDQVAGTLEREQYGESAKNNLALAVFEQAVDIRLGLLVWRILQDAYRIWRRLPKPFKVVLYRNGDLEAQFESGTRIGG